MAFLRKYISKNTFLTLIGIWNAISVYVATAMRPEPMLMAMVITVGNLVIGWLGVESGHAEPKEAGEAEG